MVIGPFTRDDWYLLRQLRQSIKEMSAIDKAKYQLDIKKDTKVYRHVLDEYLKKAA
jgi:hypothetical protein